jgi:hypothetical protein
MCANVEDAKMLKNLYLECACKCKRCKDVKMLKNLCFVQSPHKCVRSRGGEEHDYNGHDE